MIKYLGKLAARAIWAYIAVMALVLIALAFSTTPAPAQTPHVSDAAPFHLVAAITVDGQAGQSLVFKDTFLTLEACIDARDKEIPLLVEHIASGLPEGTMFTIDAGCVGTPAKEQGV